MKSELVKDKGCVYCEKVLDCKGKIKGTNCLQFEERKKNGTDTKRNKR